MVKKVVQWSPGVVNKQSEYPLRDRARQPVMANAEERR
jgi:hypothetical protein